MKTYQLPSKITALILAFGISSQLSLAEEYSWSATVEIGQSGYEFRGAKDDAPTFGFKLEKFINNNFSGFVSYHDSSTFTLNNVPRFEVNSVEVPNVAVSGNYTDFSVGGTGRYNFESFTLTATAGYSKQKIDAFAVIPGVGIVNASDEDKSVFYGFGLEYPASKHLVINFDVRQNSLLTSSEILRTTAGVEYRF